MTLDLQKSALTQPENSAAVLLRAQLALIQDGNDEVQAHSEQINNVGKHASDLRKIKMQKGAAVVAASRTGSKKAVLKARLAQVSSIRDVESATRFLKSLSADQRHGIDATARQQKMITAALANIDSGNVAVLNIQEGPQSQKNTNGAVASMEKAASASVEAQYLGREVAGKEQNVSAGKVQEALSKQQQGMQKQLSAMKKMSIIGKVMKGLQIASYLIQAAVTIATIGAGASVAVALNATQNMATNALQKIVVTIGQRVATSVAQKTATAGVQKATMTAMQKALMTVAQKIIPAIIQVVAPVSNKYYGKQISDGQIATQSAQQLYGNTKQAQATNEEQEQKLQASADQTADEVKKALLGA